MDTLAAKEEAGGRNFSDRLALWISALASPFIVVPLFVILIAAAMANTTRELIIWTGICVGFAVLVPFVYIALGVMRGQFTDIHLGIREQRHVVYLLSMGSMAVGLLALRRAGAPSELIASGVSMIVNAAVFAVITRYWKVSVHSAVLSGCILVLAVVFSWKLLWLLLLVPLVMWARVQRRRHSFAQGLVAVLICMLLTAMVFRVFGLF